jgi:hypothetical protein
MPLYPCLAVMMGAVVEMLVHSAAAARVWRMYQWMYLAAAIGVSAAAIGLAWSPGLPSEWLRISPSLAIVAAIGCALAAFALSRAVGRTDARSIRTTLLAAAAITCVAYTGLVLQISLTRGENVAAQVAKLKERMPPGTQLYSYGLQETMFTYHYGEPVIHVQSMTVEDVPRDMDFFCLSVNSGMETPATVPFAWRQVALISCDRWKRDQPQRWVIVGRRSPNSIAQSDRKLR